MAQRRHWGFLAGGRPRGRPENLVALTGSKKKAEELIGEGDLDHSKTISYEEFKKLMHTAS